MSCREMMERSTAAQCPSVGYQLAGAKKVQQDLAGSSVVEKFADGPDEAALIRACFAGKARFNCMRLLYTQKLDVS